MPASAFEEIGVGEFINSTFGCETQVEITHKEIELHTLFGWIEHGGIEFPHRIVLAIYDVFIGSLKTNDKFKEVMSMIFAITMKNVVEL